MLPSRKRSKKRAGLPIKLAGVELAAQVATAVVSDLVEAAADITQESVFFHETASRADIVARGIDLFDVGHVGRQITPDVVEMFQNLVVDRTHPLRAISHYKRFEKPGPYCYPFAVLHWDKLLLRWDRLKGNASYGSCVPDERAMRQATDDIRCVIDENAVPMLGTSAPSGHVSLGDVTMQDYNDDPENDCGAQARKSVFTTEFEDDTVALIDRKGAAGAWISSDTTVEDLSIDVEVAQ